ncbi:MAG: MBL fold metallo-hydrolase [Acidobacteria bacterium]|nr:MBL fold metallo-hydrolase [Acidobacteriota bacterium]
MLQSHGHAHPTRRDFCAQSLGVALASVPILSLAFGRAAWARGQAPAAGAQLFDIQKVADDIYLAIARVRRMINSSSVIFVNSRDVLVVDSQAQPSATAALISQIKREITTKPVRFVVNTHFHDDHIQGNSAYRRPGGTVDFIASAPTADLMAREAQVRLKATLAGIPADVEQARGLSGKATSAPEKAFWDEQVRQFEAFQAEMKDFSLVLPTVTFARSHVIKDRAHDLHIEFHGRAHTAGDVVVFCPQKRVVATGDMIFGGLPYLRDAYPRSWPGTIDSVAQLDFDQILPAHGPVIHRNRMINLRNFIEEMTARVETGKQSGKSLEELQKSITVESLKSLQDNGYGRFMAEIRDGLFPHWGRTFIGQKPGFQDAVNGVAAHIYRLLERADTSMPVGGSRAGGAAAMEN